MSGGLDALSLREDDVKKLLTCGTHLGANNLDFQMEQYVYKRKADGMCYDCSKHTNGFCSTGLFLIGYHLMGRKNFAEKHLGIAPGFPCLLESPGFFLENSRTWEVLENHFGPGKSRKLKLKVLESSGKISLKVVHFSSGSNGNFLQWTTL